MKVLSITPTFFPQRGGMEQVVLELAQRVRSYGVEMDVAHVAVDLTAGEDQVEGIRTFRVPLLGNRFLGYAPRLRGLAKGYDLLHVHDPQLLSITANVRTSCAKIPAVLSTHGGFWHTNKGYWFKKAYEATLLRGAAGHYRRVLATSVGDFEYFKKFVERLSLCSNGVQVKRFNTVVPRAQANLRRWIYWGRLSRNKRVDLAIDYAAHARELGHRVELLICGQDFDQILPALQAQVKHLNLEDRVSFVPFLDDAALRAELADRSVYITASEHEGFGLSVVEAMAAGLVVVCRDMTPLNGFIRKGESGWFLRFDSSAGDRASLNDILARDEGQVSRLSGAARQAAGEHDWDVATPRFVQHYRDAVQN